MTIQSQGIYLEDKSKLHVGEPVMVKPCSQEAAHDVIEHVLNVCSVGEKKQRKWMAIMSDSVPYILPPVFLLSFKACQAIVDKKVVTMEEFEELFHDQK